MKTLKILAATAIAASLLSCEPKPLKIEIKQSAPTVTLSSTTPDAHTLLVSAGYSINSMINLSDPAGSKTKIPKEMLLRDGLLTITSPGGQSDTLLPISDGVYGRTNLLLEPEAAYTINVYEGSKAVATATATYKPLPQVQYTKPVISKVKGDTTVSVMLTIDNVGTDDYYFVSYNTMANARKQSPTANMDISTLASFTPKHLTLLTGKDMRNGQLERKITMQVSPNDTFMLQTAKVEKAYFDYLAAYKRSGSLINQITGEPINMPTNIVKGFGFFSLFAADRKVFYLAEL